MKVLLVMFFTLVWKARSIDLNFMRVLDFEILDDIEFCEIVLDLHDIDIWLHLLNKTYLSFHDVSSCGQSLIIQKLESLTLPYSCDIANSTYIKDPNKSYLFLNENQELLEAFFTDELFNKLPCIFSKQPYFFVLTQNETNLVIDEVQVYAKSIIRFAEGVKMEEEKWSVTSSLDIHQRRKNFKGAIVKAHYDDHPVFGIINDNGEFTGYNGELATLLSKELNMSLSLTALDTYGVKLNNGSFTGTAKALQNFEIDIGLASFFQNPDRLEVSQGAFSGIFLVPEIIFWKGGDQKITFWTIFSYEVWITVSVSIFSSSLLFLLVMKQNSSIKILDLFIAITDNLKTVLVLGVDSNRYFKSISGRLYFFTICLSGALLYWNFFGDLTGYFTTGKEAPPIASFRDLESNADLRLYMQEGSAYSQHILNAAKSDPVAQRIIDSRIQWFTSSDQMLKEFIGSKESGNVLLFRTTFFLMGRLSKGQYEDEALCSITHGLLNNIREKEVVGWLYPKNSMLKRIVDKFLFDVTQRGIEEKIRREYFQPRNLRCEASFRPIGFTMVVLLFKLLASGTVFGILVLMLENMRFHIFGK